MSSEKRRFNRNNENVRKNLDSSNNQYKVYKTKADIYNSKYKTNPKLYIKLDPEYLENNYKKEENFQNNNNHYNNKNYRYIPNNNKNNNINKNAYKKSPLFSTTLKEIQSPFETNYNNYLYYASNTLENRKKNTIENFNIYKGISPFINSEKRRNVKYNNNDDDYDIQKMRNNKFDENIYHNKSIDNSRRRNKRYFDNLTMTEPKYYNPNFNIYQEKMTAIFVHIINKIYEKNKKKYILTKFLYGLKNKYGEPTLFRKRVSKHNAYKNIIFNYIKEINNSPKGEKTNRSSNNNKLINNKRKENKEQTNQRYNNTLKPKNKENNKNDMERLKELQKKYDKIYEKSKNTSADDKYRRYIFRKNKTDDSAFDKTLNNNKIFKTKLLKNRLNINRKGPATIDTSHNAIPSFDVKKKDKFMILENEDDTPRNVKNKIIVIKKIKMPPKLTNDKNKNKEIFKVYNIKNIVTRDKRLYVHINYITLSNKKKEKPNKNNYYNNQLLKISEKFSITYINNNTISKPKLKIIKNEINLTKIEEEPLNSIVEEENKYYKKKNQYDYLEKAIAILERYKNNLKKKTIKNSIIKFSHLVEIILGKKIMKKNK